MQARPLGRLAAALALRASVAALACAAGLSGAWAETLEPWQMVRSLQLLQDRIADGDQAALPMQRRILAMTDARLRKSTRAELAQPRNFDAAMVYAMGGGNPATVQALMPDLIAIADQLDAPPPPPKEDAESEETAEGEEHGAEQEAQGTETEAEHAAAEPSEHGAEPAGHGEKAESEAEGGEQHGEASEEHEAAAPAQEDAGHATAKAPDEHGGQAAGGGHGEKADGEPVGGEQHGEASGGHKAAAPVQEDAGHATAKAPDEHGSQAAEGGHGGEAGSHGASEQGHGEDAGTHEAAEPATEEAGHGAEGAKGHSEPAAEAGHGEAAGHGGDAAETHGDASGHSAKAAGHGEAGAGDAHAAPPRVGQKRKLALGVFNYGRGRLRDAEAALKSVDPMLERPEVGAYLALIKGSLAANGEPAQALQALDAARLLGTGTLVEEAALRRSVALAATLGDRPRFLLASGQYVRRFLRSPYASQFADAFVAGAVVLHEGLDLDALGAITAGMTPAQEKVVYLRIARRAAIDNLAALSAYASAKAGALPDGPADPRAALYAALPDIAAPDTQAALKRLDAIDPAGLTASDRALLDAAKAVIGETLAVPPPPPAPAAAPPAAPPAPAAAPAPAPPEPSEEAADGEEPLESVDDGQASPVAAAPATPAAAPPAEPETAAPTPEAPEAPASLTADAADTPPDPTDAKMAEARKALEAVDRMLEEARK